MRSSDLNVTVNTQIDKDKLVDTLISRIKFTGSGRENIYSITYQDESSERAKRVVQDLLSLFVESGVGSKRRDAEGARRRQSEQGRHQLGVPSSMGSKTARWNSAARSLVLRYSWG